MTTERQTGTMLSETLLTVSDVCEQLHLCRKTIYRMIQRKELRAIALRECSRKTYRFLRSEIQRWLDAKIRITYPSTEFVKVQKWL
jgi:excisionase family DNA binding protein